MNAFIESLKGSPKNTGAIIRALNQRMCMFRYDEETGGIFASDQEGRLITKAEFTEMAEGMQIFFDQYSDTDIEGYNIDAARRRLSERQDREEKIRKSVKPGWVYLVRGQLNQYKIGMTTRAPSERLAEFIPKLPFDSKLVCTIETNTPIELEEYLHSFLAEKRVRGEWFELTDLDVDWIKGGAL